MVVVRVSELGVPTRVELDRHSLVALVARVVYHGPWPWSPDCKLVGDYDEGEAAAAVSGSAIGAITSSVSRIWTRQVVELEREGGFERGRGLSWRVEESNGRGEDGLPS
ncbi:LOW QUALITY PROTEIN: hypothetical protein PanWU01x14_067680 [Parasponia andersonii]|uniref:Uncharacterized protein n=1 Tax=Parasponia andersonii TaxID=3476 RepID=A0A2P5DF32_PARAD|nr:LOW QUALITY PROTEIN: hypothetical protein PanWU01x14_067680 [Parasponia andersonii]